VDLALIPLYLAKGLIMLAALYLFYLVLSIWGLVAWRRVLAGRVVPE
jgi:nicotinamide mononucleotide transporter